MKLAGNERRGRARDVTDPDERRRCGDLMGAKYVWGGDPDIGLTYHAWCYDVPAIAAETMQSRPGRARLERVILSDDDGTWRVRRTGGQSSGVLTSMVLNSGVPSWIISLALKSY